MAIDLALLKQVEACPEPLTWVRFYRWKDPTVTLGKHQRPGEAVDVEYCRRYSIPIVHRPTGGRAVLHSDELTYAVISNDRRGFPQGDISRTYLRIAEVLHRGLSDLGVQSEIARVTGRHSVEVVRPSRRSGRSPCFAAVSRYEIVSGGRKLVGSAQRLLKQSFLQHGSLPLSVDYRAMAAAMATSEDALRRSLVAVAEVAGRRVGFGELARALWRRFQQLLGPETPLYRGGEIDRNLSNML